MHNLKELILNENKVSSLEPIKDLKELRIILASENNIDDVSELISAPSLIGLVIANNPVADDIEQLIILKKESNSIEVIDVLNN